MNPLTESFVVVALLAVVAAGFVWWWLKSLTKKVVSAAAKSQIQPPRAQAHGMKPDPPPQQQELGAPVFASYSRKDAELVRRILGLFRAADLPVFRDEDGIRPGRKWRIAIDAALEQCQTILVFWCGHAAQSSEVENEYERAISLDKRVVPVLMDHTELPTHLGQYQGVDLRMVLGESHESLMAVVDEEIRDMTTSASYGAGWEQAMEARRQRFEEADRIFALASRHLESSLNSIL